MTVSLPPDACQRLMERASAAGCSTSELVRRLVDARVGQPDLIAAAVVADAPAIVWSDGVVGGVWAAPSDL